MGLVPWVFTGGAVFFLGLLWKDSLTSALRSLVT